MKTQINFGIIGLGRIAHKFAADIRLVPEARLHAVASTDASRAKAFAEQHGAEYSFGSYEAILNCPHLDVVYVATTNDTHAAVTLMCLRRRIAVVCEKPFGLNSREVREMLDTAHANGTFLMEAMWSRFVPAFRKAVQIVADGGIGRPLSIKADFCFAVAPNAPPRALSLELGGGSWLDIGIYPAMLALSVLGKPLKINALAHLAPSGVDDNCAVLLGYADGAIAMLHSAMSLRSKTEAYIYGEKGTLYLPPPFHHPKSIVVDFNDGSRQVFEYPFEGHGYQFEIQEVVNCLKNNQLESAQMPHRFSLDLIELLDAVRQQIGLVFLNRD